MTKTKANENQLSAKVTEGNEMVLIESRYMRDQNVYRDDVIEKVKAISLLGDKFEATLQIAADYYEVPLETIKTAIKTNRVEFNEYSEMRLLKGKLLAEFKGQVVGQPELNNAPSLTLLNRRGILRLGMILTKSEIAKSIRNYLLNVEEISDDKQKAWAVEREISKRERRRLTDSIQQFYTGVLKGKPFEYSTFTNLVYKVLFDSNAAKMKVAYGLDKNDQLRDALTTEDLRKVVEVETVMASLLRIGKEYEEIKNELISKQERFQ